MPEMIEEMASMLKPVYKCRLCGEPFVYQTFPIEEKDAHEDITRLVLGEDPVSIDAAHMTEVHHCRGPYAGSLGLADFLGFRKLG